MKQKLKKKENEYKYENSMKENENNTKVEEKRLNMDLELNKMVDNYEKEKKLYETEINKRNQLINQQFQKQNDDYMLQIMMAQMISAQMQTNNINS